MQYCTVHIHNSSAHNMHKYVPDKQALSVVIVAWTKLIREQQLDFESKSKNKKIW